MFLDAEKIKLLFDHYGYIVLFAGAFIEGFHIMLMGGFLSALHYIRLFPAFWALALGNFSADFAIFMLGHYGGERTVNWLARYKPSLPRAIEKAKKYLHKYPFRIFFIVKITTGLAMATILTAGVTKMRVSRFFISDFISNFIVVFIVVGIGFFLGRSYEAAYKYIQYFGWAMLLMVIIILGVAQHVGSRFLD